MPIEQYPTSNYSCNIMVEDKKYKGFYKLSKDKAGCLLDGVEYKEMPNV